MRLKFDMMCSSEGNTFTAFPARLPAASATLLTFALHTWDRENSVHWVAHDPSSLAAQACRAELPVLTGISGADFLL